MIKVRLSPAVELAITFRHHDRTSGRGTYCILHDTANGVCIGHGWSLCHPSDNFCKETGRKLALAKALKQVGMSRDERRVVWEAYFGRGV